MADLHFDITGDPSCAMDALHTVSSGIDDLGRQSASPAISTSGADQAIREMRAVGQARDAITGMSTINIGATGLADARSGVRGLGNDIQGMARQTDTSLGRLNDSLESTGTGLGNVARLGGEVGQGIAAQEGAFGRLGASGVRAMGGMQQAAEGLEKRMGLVKAAVGGTTQDFTELNSMARSVKAGAASGRHLTSVPTGPGAQGFGAGSSMAYHAPSGTYYNSAVNPNGPPPGGSGGSGGPPSGNVTRGPWRGSGPPSGGGGGLGDLWDKPPPSFMSALAGPAMMGTMIGGVSDLLTAAVGFEAVNEAIKQTPDLAYAAHGAMGQFDKSIRQAAQHAVTEGVPALHELGQSMRGLGGELGAVGAEHMGQALGSLGDLAGHAEQGLARLDPAIGPAIEGMTKLGDSIMDGFTSPSAIQGINAVSKSLSNPANEAAIADTVSGIVTVAGTITAAVADTAGALNKILPGGLGDTTEGPMTAGLAAAGMGYMRGGAKGALKMGLPAAGMELFAEQGEKSGISPAWAFGGGIIGGLIGAALGHPKEGAFIGTAAGEGIGDVVRGDAPFPSGPFGLKDAHEALGGAQGQSPFPQLTEAGAQAAGRYGWRPGGKGEAAYVPMTPQESAHERSLAAQQRGQAALDAKTSGMGPLLTGTSPGQPLRPDMTHGTGFGVMPIPPSTMQQLNQQTSSLSSNVQNLNQNTQSAMPAVQQYGQSWVSSAQTMRQTFQNAQGNMQGFDPGHMSSMFGQASSIVGSQAQAVGASVPQNFQTGVQQNQGAACNATADMAAQATQCASDAVGFASPAKAFIPIGASTPAGFAVGVLGAAGIAGAATGAMMQNTVDVASNYAANGGQMLGYTFATNMVSGINTVLQSNLYQTLGLAQGVGSPLAQSLLGLMGLYGVAGSGAQTVDLRNAGIVSFGAGTPAQPAVPPPTFNLNLNVNGQQIQAAVASQHSENWEEFLTALATAAR